MSKFTAQYLDNILKIAEDEANSLYRDIQVVELLNPYVKQRPHDGMAWLLLGDALRVIGRFDDSYATLMKALEFAPDEHKAYVYARLGMLHEKHKSPRDAEKWYKMAVECGDKLEGWVLVLRGANLAALGEFSRSLECYQHALNVCSDHNEDEIYMNMGLVHVAMGDYNNALLCMMKALELNPAYLEAEEYVDSLSDLGKHN
jgi:tetratricopeptide (TPR) repeat protein